MDNLLQTALMHEYKTLLILRVKRDKRNRAIKIVPEKPVKGNKPAGIDTSMLAPTFHYG